MILEWAVVVLLLIVGAVTVWLQTRQQRTRDERKVGAAVDRSYGFTQFLGVFLPLVGLPALVQFYVEYRKGLYLALAALAAFGVIVGLARLADDYRKRSRKGGAE
ncbi:MAG TPA: hypothetical protein VGC20_06145 [bacterium]